MGKALLLPKDKNHWEKWDDEFLLLNMKRVEIMVNCSSSELFLLLFCLVNIYLYVFIASIFVGLSMLRGGRRQIPGGESQGQGAI